MDQEVAEAAQESRRYCTGSAGESRLLKNKAATTLGALETCRLDPTIKVCRKR